MSRAIGLIVVLVLSVCADVRSQPALSQAPVPYEITVEESLSSLVRTLNRSALGSIKFSAGRVVGARRDNPLFGELEKELIKRRGSARYSVSEIKTEAKDGLAKVTYTLTMTDGLGGQMVQAEELTFKRVEKPFEIVWHAIPGLPDEVVGGNKTGLLLHFVTALAYPDEVLRKSRAEMSAANLEELSMGIYGLCQDYDEVFAVDNRNFKKQLLPYTTGERIFYSPADTSGEVSYSINDKLTGLKLNQIRNWESTVVLYEGRGGELAYRHDGRALVALSLGVVKFVTPEEAKALHWDP